jgi:hypothetical protein
LPIKFFLNLSYVNLRSLSLAPVTAVPPFAKKPSDEVQAVLAVAVLQVTADELCTYRGANVTVPASLSLDDDLDRNCAQT